MIGARVWVCANVVILRGTRIGNDCVIGAGNVVKGNIPDGSLVTGPRELHIEKLRMRRNPIENGS